MLTQLLSSICNWLDKQKVTAPKLTPLAKCVNEVYDLDQGVKLSS